MSGRTTCELRCWLAAAGLVAEAGPALLSGISRGQGEGDAVVLPAAEAWLKDRFRGAFLVQMSRDCSAWESNAGWLRRVFRMGGRCESAHATTGVVDSDGAREASGQIVRLKGIAAKDAGTLVRTIAEIRDLRFPDEKTLVVQGTADQLTLVTALLEMAAAPGDPSGSQRLALSNGLVVVCLRLERAAPADVMRALMAEVQVGRVTASEDGRMFLRDTEAKIEAALAVIRRLEGAGSD